MFDLEKSIADWKKGLRRYESIEDGFAADIELHLRDAFEAGKEEGLDDESAFARAAGEVGTPEAIASEYVKNRARAFPNSSVKSSRIWPALAWSGVKTAWRRIRREKGFAFINIAGLAVGLGSAMLIALFVRHELSYDRFHPKGDRVFRLVSGMQGASYDAIAKVPGPWGREAVKELPEIEQAVRLVIAGEKLVARGDRRFEEKGGFYCDPAFFEVFGYTLSKGDPATALVRRGTIVVTEAFAARYFGGGDPVGRALTLDNKDEFLVTGIVARAPGPSHLSFDFLLSMESYPDPRRDNWEWMQYYTYLLLRDQATAPSVPGKISSLLARNIEPASASRYRPILQPVASIHLRSRLFREIQANSDISTVYIFSAIGIFILLVACFNFVNLATARATTRAKEVGVRKVAGAKRPQLVRQFLGESVLIAFIGLAAAAGLTAGFLPLFGRLTEKPLGLPGVGDFPFWLGTMGLTLFIGVLSGTYPAVVLSAFKPVNVLKGRSRSCYGWRLRKGLVVFQFAISSALIMATGIITAQLDFIQSRRLGFNPRNLVIVPIRDRAMIPRIETLKSEIRKDPGVVSVAASGNLPGGSDWGIPYAPEGFAKGAAPEMRILAVDHDFVDTFEIKMASGRSFSREFPSDATAAFMLNEEAARALGWADAVGKTIAMPAIQRDKAPVIGVVRNFHFRSLHEKIGPILFFIPPPDWLLVVAVRIRPDNAPATLASLERIWKEFDPGHPFDYSFFDGQFARLHRSEAGLRRLIGYFAILAIAIACLGLFGLAAFSAAERTKEIGIRKVLGASVWNIVTSLSKEFTGLVLIGFVAALPPAVLIMIRWLAGFAYRVKLGPDVLVISALMVLAVAWLTVGYQSIRAAMARPADSLRAE